MECPGPQTEELPSNEEKRRHVESVLNSVTFSNAPVLKSFLQFIVTLAQDGRSEEISEYAIATQVFGRPPKFDPASDTIVRTQAYRLRLKLKEYYEREGESSGITIEIPKGHYVPLFQYRRRKGSDEAAIPLIEFPAQPQPELTPAISAPVNASERTWRVAGMALIALTLFVCGSVAGTRWASRIQPVSSAKLAQGVETQFWSGFLGLDRRITVSFMDLHYLTSDSGALLSIRGESPTAERGAPADPSVASNQKLAALAGHLYYENGYAGLGDMVAMHRMAMFFANLDATTTLTRVHQLTLDALKNSDLVFLGDFRDRGTIVWLPERWPWRFSFKDGPGIWGKIIVDAGAPGGAASQYELRRDPDSGVIRTDYALVSVIPGVNSAHRIVNLAGLTTSGTQGAAEYMSSEAGLREILDAIGLKENGRATFPRFFQCVLRVEVAHGLDVISTKYVTGAAFQPK